jgi:hypothetical protein
LFRRFARSRVEPLHSDADAEEWNAARDGRANGWREAGRVEPLRGGKVAHAGQHDALGGFDGRNDRADQRDFSFRAHLPVA